MPPGAVIRIRDRQTGALFTERVFGGSALEKLYGRAGGRLLTGLVLSRRAPNAIYGWLQRRSSSRARIARFIESLGIDPSEAEHPPERYGSLDEFFIRRLKPGARPVDERPGLLVSPADGRVLVYPQLRGSLLRVKESSVSLDELLRDPAAARPYAEGAAIVVRLAPADYHRFHFPEGGTASESRAIAGRLHSVHPIALTCGAPSLRNKRSITYLDTSACGLLALIEIGALCVGTIVQSYHPGKVERGQEKGHFRFGGSTVVVIAEPGRLVLDEDLVEASREGIETLVRMGTSVGRCR